MTNIEKSGPSEAVVDRVRAFNRFYTRRLDLLRRGFLDSPYSLGEVRVLWEIAHRGPITAGDLARDLDVDAGQLSRMLKRFATAGLIERTADAGDARRSPILLTPHGRAVYEPLEAEQCRRVAADLAGLGREATGRLVDAMADVERLLDPPGTSATLLIRPHRTGEVAAIVARQARLYAEDHGFDQRFEALVMEIGAAFLRDFDPREDASFVAEVGERIVGAVFVTRESPEVAKLRLLHVESEMRGRGIGRCLVEASIAFARAHGHRTLTLWTNDVLVEARRLYERCGFRRVGTEPHTMFGPPLVGETWDLAL
ncbi:MAG: GNAT family N-acetyltransferase [Phyllobacteriaceae bacterium]|nr:GNAT family N-acetyltransferase [Phyllobacteriaceae bacterium]